MVEKAYKLTPGMEDTILDLISNGLTAFKACETAEISRGTLYAHCKDNPELMERLQEAEREGDIARCAKAENLLSDAMDKTDQVGVTAAKFMLERNPKSRYRQGVIELPVSGKITIDFGPREERDKNGEGE